MTDPTEDIRKQMLAEINAPRLQGVPGSTSTGKSGTPRQLSEDFDVIGFAAPLVVVRRKSDGQKGSLMFQARPGSTSALSRIARDTADRGVEDDAPFFQEKQRWQWHSLTTNEVESILRDAVDKGCYVEHSKSDGTAKAFHSGDLVFQSIQKGKTDPGSAGSSTPNISPGLVRRQADLVAYETPT